MSRWNPQPPEVRFWYFVQKQEGCWPWLGGKDNDGYGIFCLEGKVEIRRYIKAHRFIYTQIHGPIADNVDVHHICKNTSCVNPDHLIALDRLSHAKEGKWANITHCKRGHLYDEKNTYHNPSRPASHRICRQCVQLRRRNYSAKKGSSCLTGISKSAKS